MELSKTKLALEDFKNTIVRRAKLELGTTRPRERRRTQWKNVGTKKKPVWKVKSSVTKMKKGRYVASGKLQQSISGKLTSQGSMIQLQISQESYGENVEKGRKPKGKQPPHSNIMKWMTSKRIKVQDLKTNKFVKQTASRKKGLAYVIARSIAEFGIKPFPYMDMAFEYAINKHLPLIENALKQDMENGIND